MEGGQAQPSAHRGPGEIVEAYAVAGYAGIAFLASLITMYIMRDERRMRRLKA